MRTLSQAKFFAHHREVAKGTLLVALGAIVISFSAVFVRLSDTGPTVDGFYRMLFGGMGLLLISLIKRERPHMNSGFKPWWLCFLAAIFFAGDLAFWHRSIDAVGPGVATLITNAQVFFLVLISALFLNEKPSLRIFIALPLAIFGLFLLVGIQWRYLSPAYHLGIYQGLIAAVSYSLFILCLQRSRALSKPFAATLNLALQSLLSAAILGLLAFWQGESFIAHGWLNWTYLLAYGLLCQIGGWLLISYGLPKISLLTGSFLLLLQPTFSFIWDVLFFHRPTPFIQVVGFVLTLVAIYIAATAKRQG